MDINQGPYYRCAKGRPLDVNEGADVPRAGHWTLINHSDTRHTNTHIYEPIKTKMSAMQERECHCCTHTHRPNNAASRRALDRRGSGRLADAGTDVPRGGPWTLIKGQMCQARVGSWTLINQ